MNKLSMQKRGKREAQTVNLFDDLEATVQEDIRSLQARVEYLEAAIQSLTTPKPKNNKRFGSAANALTGFQRKVALHGGYVPVVKKAAATIAREGPRALLRHLRSSEQEFTFRDEAWSPGSYINEIVTKRKDVLGSSWHIGLIRSRTINPNQEQLPSITISAVTYNSDKWLKGFLSSLIEQCYPLHLINIVFVDHGSEDETLSALDAFNDHQGHKFGSISILRRPNKGFGAGHNVAIEYSSDEFIMVTNVDLIFHDETILRAVLAAQADHSQVACWELSQSPLEHPKYYDPVTLETAWCAHACVLFRRAALDEAGGYDEHIFMYGEDVELSYRLRACGWLLRYLPWVQVTHFVDLENAELRPHQLGGSLAASVLLRYRYADANSAIAAEKTLLNMCKLEDDPTRRQGFTEAIRIINKERRHFLENRKPDNQVSFPFNGFDYLLSRDGHDISVPAVDPLVNGAALSVVTRTHGPAIDCLKEAVASVLNQRHPSIEHVIVEDRGNFARELIETTAVAYDRPIRYVASCGEGRSAAGNAGMAAATGDFLMILDNDDLLFADHASTLVSHLQDNPELVAAYSLSWEVRKTETENGYSEDLHLLPAAFRQDFSRLRLRRGNFIPIQAIVFRRELFTESGGFNEELDALEDWYLWNKYAQFGPFELVPKLTSLFHTPSEGAARHERQKFLDEAYENVRGLIRNNLS